jgi:glucose-6-phosphate 1-dehydrogenase
MNSPTHIVILGITGDLSQKKILPALFSLYIQSKLPERVCITGFSRRSFSQTDIQDFIRNTLPEHDKREEFLSLCSYVQGDFGDIDTYITLAQHIEKTDSLWGQCSNKLYYLSVSPQYYKEIFTYIQSSGLGDPCGGDLGWARILVEKPFGYDMISSKHLNALVDTLFLPLQVYRIDHYMAKTSLQKMISIRQDSYMKKKWNSEHIDQIDIDLLETGTLENRGQFYDSLGTVYDVVQNHIMQMIGLALREITQHEDALAIQHSREHLCASLVVDPQSVYRAQYIGYTEHVGVKPHSQTETYIDSILHSTIPQYSGIPIHVRTGKGLDISYTGITVRWKDGTQTTVSTPHSESQQAYEKILSDCMNGDQSVFTSGKEVEIGWKIAEEIKKEIEKTPLDTYSVGTMPVKK